MAQKKEAVQGSRRQSRECALQFLFQWEFQGGSVQGGRELEAAFVLFCRHFERPKRIVSYGMKLVAGFMEQKNKVDELIRANAKNWRLERMTHVDRNILRIAVLELCFHDDVPARVAINEAVEMAKMYGDSDSPSFINGILDSVNRTVHNDA